MKGKFIFVFANGEKIIDRNGFKTLAAAKSWAKAHNRGTRGKAWKIIATIKR